MFFNRNGKNTAVRKELQAVERKEKKLYQTALKAFLKDTRECCHKRGAPYMLLCDDAPFEETFLPAMACNGIISS